MLQSRSLVLMSVLLLGLGTAGVRAETGHGHGEGSHAVAATAATEAAPTAHANGEYRNTATQGEGHAAVHVAGETGYVSSVILFFMWLFILAIMLGPVVMFFRRPDPPEETAGHGGHGAGHH